MELIRLQLMEVEGEEPKPNLSDYSEEERVYHMALLIDAKLVNGEVIKNHIGMPVQTISFQLTWQGHEFLDASRNEGTWQKVMKKITSNGASFTFEIVKTVLVELTKNELKSIP